MARQQNKRKQYCYQALIFFLCYFGFSILHNTREVWSFLKDDLQDDGYSKGQLGALDLFFLFFYSVGLYIAGALGDNFNIRFILFGGYMLVCLSMLMISFGYIWGIRGLWWYIIWFSANGLFQAVGWPLNVAVMGYWFPRKGRGVLMGIWTTCSNIGDITGLWLAQICNDVLGMSWMWTYFVAACIVAFLGIMYLLLMIPHPSKVGLEIKEFEDDDVAKED